MPRRRHRADSPYIRPPGFGRHFFSQWVEGRIQAGQTVPLFTDQYRTPILAQNLAEALLELIANDSVGTIHLAGTERIDRYTFAKKMAQELRLDSSGYVATSLNAAPFRARRPKDLSFNVGLAQSVLSTPLLSVNRAIQRMARDSAQL